MTPVYLHGVGRGLQMKQVRVEIPPCTLELLLCLQACHSDPLAYKRNGMALPIACNEAACVRQSAETLSAFMCRRACRSMLHPFWCSCWQAEALCWGRWSTAACLRPRRSTYLAGAWPGPGLGSYAAQPEPERSLLQRSVLCGRASAREHEHARARGEPPAAGILL